MEDQQQPKTGKFALNYGILLGAVSIVFGLMLYFLDMHYQQELSLLAVSIVIMLIVIIIGINQFKKANGGYLSFGQGLKVGVGIALIGGIIGMIYNLILTNVIDPDTAAKQLEYAKGKMVARGMTQEEISRQVEGMKMFSGPAIQIAMGLIFSLVLGFLLSLIPTLVMKKSENAY